MQLQLKRIRESKRISQKQMAQMISELIGEEVKLRTYGSWERQEVTMNLEQAYYCCLALNCTLNDLVGMESERSFSDPRQAAVNGHFETFNDLGRTELATVAERMSHDPAVRIEKNRVEHDRVPPAMGA